MFSPLASKGWLLLAGMLIACGFFFPRKEPPSRPPTEEILGRGPATSSKRSTPTPSLPKPLASQDLWRAVVRIVPMEIRNGEWYPLSWGSGTLIHPSGLILTNYHVVTDDRYRVDRLLVQVTQRPDQPPRSCCFARVVQWEPWVDLAVLQITEDLEGRPLQRRWPYVALGDSLRLSLGQPLYIYGYPGIGGDTITSTVGEVAGFTEDFAYGPRAWIKTSATIAGGNSGGLAADAQGRLVGIPTQFGSGRSEEYVDCRRLADTNRDGVIDEADICVPMGGFINALRPVHLALPLIQAATIRSSPETDLAWAPNIQPDTLVYEDTFEDPNWPTKEDSVRRAFYERGEYVVHVFPKDTQVWFWDDEAAPHPDMWIQLVARVVRPSANQEGEWGILCRVTPDGEGFYAFRVSEDGYLRIDLKKREDTHVLTDWTPLPGAVPFDPRQGVRLEAACVANQLLFWVNGHLVAYQQDFSFYQHGAGFFVATDDETGDFAVAFDRFAVYTATLRVNDPVLTPVFAP